MDGQLWAQNQNTRSGLLRAGYVTQSLLIENIGRQYSGKVVTCQSSNSQLTSAKNVSLALLLNRKATLIAVLSMEPALLIVLVNKRDHVPRKTAATGSPE